MNKKKRICLIGVEHGHASTAHVLSMARLEDVERWARRGGFDDVGILCGSHGLCRASEAELLPAKTLGKMGRKEREAWAERVAAAVKSRWDSGAECGLKEVVLLCGLSGYQELERKLSAMGQGVRVTMPLGGTEIVPQSSIEQTGLLASESQLAATVI